MELADLVDNLSIEDPVSIELMSNHIPALIALHFLWQPTNDDTFQSVLLTLVGTSKSNAVTLEFLSHWLYIGQPNTLNILNATTDQLIHSTGSLVLYFYTNKGQVDCCWSKLNEKYLIYLRIDKSITYQCWVEHCDLIPNCLSGVSVWHYTLQTFNRAPQHLCTL